ncbi:hypothetical protein KFE94_10095 [bacterium SCSIO 12643]|nr:hypothetical protein KFE94_10095 [bacterium SCSIO 12643]
MKNARLLVLLTIFLGLGQFTFAQNEGGDLKAEYKSFIETTFQNTFNTMSESGTPDHFIQNFSQAFKGSIIHVGIDGRGDVNNFDYKQLRDATLKLIGQGSISRTWTIANINYLNVRSKTGISSFEVKVATTKDGETLSEETSLMELVSIKTAKGWKVTYLSITQIEEEVFKGRCYCDIYSKDENEFLAQLYEPKGTEYNLTTNNIYIGKYNGKRFIRVNDQYIFYWDLTNSQITYEDKVVGTAKTHSTAIQLALKTLNIDNCTSVALRKKGK